MKARLVLLVGSVYSMTLGVMEACFQMKGKPRKKRYIKGEREGGREGGKEAERT